MNGSPQVSVVSTQLSVPVLQTPLEAFLNLNLEIEQHSSELMLHCISLRVYVLLFRLQTLNSWRLGRNLLVNSA